MPVIHAWEANTVVTLKRNLEGAGYCGLLNPLFYKNNARFYKGNANETLLQLNNYISSNSKEFFQQVVSKTEVIKEKVEEVKDYQNMKTYKKIGIPKECGLFFESRVALSPVSAGKLRELGFEIYLETNAGLACNFSDDEYKKYCCNIVTKEQVFQEAEIIVKINEPTEKEVNLLKSGQILVSIADPYNKKELLEQVKSKGVTWLAMDKVPRTSVAQKLDCLTTAGKIAGYRATIEAFYYYQGFPQSQTTAAGSYPHARVLVIGAGVAGLEIIGIATSLGAEVFCFDTRSECREQVESQGGVFLDLLVPIKEDGAGAGGYAKPMSPEYIAEEMKLFTKYAKYCDIVITTAAVPGRRAPLLFKKEAVDAMKSGSVIIDLSARTGGNCELTRNGGVYTTSNGVTIVGHLNFPSLMPRIASEMFGTNIVNLFHHMGGAEKFKIDLDDETIKYMQICANGETTIKNPPAQAPNAKTAVTSAASAEEIEESGVCGTISIVLLLIIAIVILVMVAMYFPFEFYNYLMVFTLSSIIGYLTVWGVTPSLHTPLMSVTNAISGIVILGAIPFVTEPIKSAPLWLGMVAVLLAAINIGGGFYVTHRMLAMFILKEEKAVVAPASK